MSTLSIAAEGDGGDAELLLPRPHPDHRPPRFSGTFSRAQPAALGTVQIMVGLWFFVLGVGLAVREGSLDFYPSPAFFGSSLYVVSGSLTVAAGKSDSRRLFTACLVMNMAAALLSSVLTVFMICYVFLMMMLGGPFEVSLAWLALFQFLEFCVSATLVGFACRASCDHSEEPVQVDDPSAVIAEAPPPEAPPPEAPPPNTSTEAPPLVGREDRPSVQHLPPAYSEYLTSRAPPT